MFDLTWELSFLSSLLQCDEGGFATESEACAWLPLWFPITWGPMLPSWLFGFGLASCPKYPALQEDRAPNRDHRPRVQV